MLQQDLTYLKNRTYGITLKVFKGEEEQERKRLDYQMSVDISGSQPGRPYWYLSFVKNEVYYNRHEADLVSERLNTKISEAIYPVTVGVTRLNEIYEKMFLHSERLKNWEEKKKEIQKKYDSETVDLLFKRLNNQFEHPYLFWKNLKKEYFWSLFFYPLFHLEVGQKMNSVVALSLFPFKMSSVEGELMWHDDVTYYNTHLITFKGNTIVDMEEYEKAFKVKIDVSNILVEVEIEWDLDDVYNFVKHIEMKMVYKAHDDENEVVLRRVEWTCYMTDQIIREIIVEKKPTTWAGKFIDWVLNL